MTAVARPDSLPIAAVVASRDRAEHLAAAVESLLRARRPGDEVVVVDSASSTDAVRRVAEDAGVRCVRCERPGVSRARNAGLRATSAPVVAFTDDDCVVAGDWFEIAGRGFSSPAVGFVTGRVLPDRQIGEILSVLVDETPRELVGEIAVAGIGHGANMVWRRTAFEAIGGLDELLGPGARLRYAEEHDAFWRALRAGWHGRYVPDLVVTHRQWRGRSAFLKTKWGYGFGSGAFASKVRRIEPREGRRLLVETLWDQGLVQAWRDLRSGYEAGAAGSLAKAVGVVCGAVQGRRTPLDGTARFVDRRAAGVASTGGGPPSGEQ